MGILNAVKIKKKDTGNMTIQRKAPVTVSKKPLCSVLASSKQSKRMMKTPTGTKHCAVWSLCVSSEGEVECGGFSGLSEWVGVLTMAVVRLLKKKKKSETEQDGGVTLLHSRWAASPPSWGFEVWLFLLRCPFLFPPSFVCFFLPISSLRPLFITPTIPHP